MANETPLTVLGNTTAPAELRFTASGAAVASFTVASTPRTFDRQSNEWKDGETLFLRCSVWREQAENVAETLSDKGMAVIVQGNLKQRSYEKDGEKRTVYELDVQEIGPSLRYATATVTRTQKNGGNLQNTPPQNGYAGRSSAPQGTPQGNRAPHGNQPPQVDNWGAQQSGNNYSWGNSEEAPF